MTVQMVASVIITGISCLLVLLLVLFIGSAVLKKLKKEVFCYIKLYNRHLEEGEGTKTHPDAADKRETDGAEQTHFQQAEPAIPFIAKSEPMRNADFFLDYLTIRNAFCQSAAEALRELPVQSEEDKSYAACINRLLEKLSFEVVYQLSCQRCEWQEAVLEELLSPEEKEVLNKYRMEQPGTFDITAFSLFLKEQSRALDATVYVYAREPQRLGIRANTELLQLCKDENMCEGFFIMQGNRLYDYGVRSSEITL